MVNPGISEAPQKHAPRQAMRIGLSLFLWLGLAFSLGWYYTFTYYGRTGIPIPLPEVILGILLYYFSVINSLLWIEAIHWMLMFPLAGFIWAGSLWTLAPRFGGKRPDFRQVLWHISCAAIPLIIPSPWMMWMAGQTEGGFTLRRAIGVALRQGNIDPPAWLTPLYLLLGLAALVIQGRVIVRLFDIHGWRACRFVLVSFTASVMVSCVIGAALSVPLRMIFE
jgi:hypothetical protein